MPFFGLDIMVFQQAKAITQAELRTLNSAPVTIIASPGIGKIIIPISATFQYTAGSDVFTSNLQFRLTYPSLLMNDLMGGNLAADFTTTDRSISWGTASLYDAINPTVNDQSIIATMSSDLVATGPDTGHGEVVVVYYVIDFSI